MRIYDNIIVVVIITIIIVVVIIIIIRVSYVIVVVGCYPGCMTHMIRLSICALYIL